MRKNRNTEKRVARIEAVVADARDGAEISATSMAMAKAFNIAELEEMEARLLANPGATLADVYTPEEMARILARIDEVR